MTTRAAELFETFTGAPSRRTVTIEVPAVAEGSLPEHTAYAGRAVAIEYEILKPGDTGEVEIYRHEFGEAAGAVVLAEPSGKSVLYVVGDFVVGEEGITDVDERVELGYDDDPADLLEFDDEDDDQEDDDQDDDDDDGGE